MAFQLDAALLTLHLLFAALWFGAGWYDKIILAPAVRSAGVAGIETYRELTRRGGAGRFFGPASILTVITGVALYVRTGTGIGNTAGILVTIGAVLGVLAFLLGLLEGLPLHKRLLAASEAAGDGAGADALREMQGIVARMDRHSTIAGALVTTAFVLMAGRYVFS